MDEEFWNSRVECNPGTWSQLECAGTNTDYDDFDAVYRYAVARYPGAGYAGGTLAGDINAESEHFVEHGGLPRHHEFAN